MFYLTIVRSILEHLLLFGGLRVLIRYVKVMQFKYELPNRLKVTDLITTMIFSFIIAKELKFYR